MTEDGSAMRESIPRLSFSELDPQLAEMLRPKVERLNYLGEFFQCMGHQPQALMAFHTLTEELKKALPDNLTEVVALSMATAMGNDYEQVQHERLALKLGFSEAWVSEAIAIRGQDAKELTAAEVLVQKLALAIIECRGHGTTEELEAVVHSLGHAQAVGVLLLIGRYAMHALLSNSLALKAPVASPLA